MLPDPAGMERLTARCLELFGAGAPLGAVEIADDLMALPELPMHCPDHHLLVPAALLTAAHLRAGRGRVALEADLKKAAERAAIVPGGVCGNYGCCGAAIGGGIFAAVWNKTSPMSKSGWAAGNAMTARCLEAVASVEGPRCCKRVVYLAVTAALPAARELLDLDPVSYTHLRPGLRPHLLLRVLYHAGSPQAGHPHLHHLGGGGHRPDALRPLSCAPLLSPYHTVEPEEATPPNKGGFFGLDGRQGFRISPRRGLGSPARGSGGPGPAPAPPDSGRRARGPKTPGRCAPPAPGRTGRSRGCGCRCARYARN